MEVAEQIQPRLESAIGQRYEVLGPIGRGGMASVYLARHRVHGGFCAVKVLADHLAKQPPLVRSFLAEARASASLDEHPNIVNIVDIDEHAGLYYMIMKYIEGEDLSTYLKRKRVLPWKQAAYIAAEVAEALAWSHDRGVIHRDLKPSNIRLGRRGRITVMDFGIAKVGQTPSSFTEMGTRAGTPHYMAPEQIRGDKVDHRSDLYGLGVILYQMTTGTRPFEGANPALIWQAHMTEEPKAPQEVETSIPDPLSHIIVTLLAKDVEKRYDAAARVVRHLRTLGLEGVASTLDPVDQLNLDHLRTQEIRARAVDPTPAPSAEITETGQTGPQTVETGGAADLTGVTSPPPPREEIVEAATRPVAETRKPPTGTATAPKAPPATPPAVEQPPRAQTSNVPTLPVRVQTANVPSLPPVGQTSSVPTLPPPAHRPAPRAPDTAPFEVRRGSGWTTWVIGAVVAVGIGVAAALLLRPGTANRTEQPPAQTVQMPAEPQPVTPAPEAPPVEEAAPAPQPPAVQPAPPPPTRKAAPPRTGAVYFRTEPPGAAVQVDNRPDWRCETPCWLESLSVGPHTVTARMEGYRVAIERVEVAGGAREPLLLKLQADLISVMIGSTPPGAEIYIDGEKRAEKTNARIGLRPGTYQVRVVLPGTAEGEQALVVSENQMPFANFVLTAK